MSKKYYIQKTVKIRESKIFIDNKLVFHNNENTVYSFLKEAYSFFQLKYPKYHKMDSLSKLGILAASLLFEKVEVNENTGLVFSNSASSLEVDREHSKAMQEIVSPSIFVYTLPNIVLGEISIKYNLKGENIFFIEPQFNPELISNYVHILMDTGKSNAVVCGWIDLENGEYDVFLSLITKEGKVLFSEENLEKLYLFDNE